MAVPYHTHTFDIPTASPEEAAEGSISNKVVVPSSLPGVINLAVDAAVDAAISATTLYDTRAAAAATSIDPTIHSITTKGQVSAGDELAGLYIDTDTGSTETFTSADGRTWYRAIDVSEARISGTLKVNADITVTVGTGGNFSTINAALEYLSKRAFRYYKKGGYSAVVSLLSGFVMAEEVHLRNGMDLGWVTITSVSSTVTITRSALTTDLGDGNYAAFAAINNAVLPVIGAQFVMNTSGTATNRHGVFISTNSRCIIGSGAGVRSAGGTGLFVYQSSIATASGADFSYAGLQGVFAWRSSIVHAGSVNASYAGQFGILSEDCSNVVAKDCNVSFAGVYGLYVWRASNMYAADCIATDCGATAIAQGFDEGCGLKVHHASKASVYRGNFSRATHYGIYARHACVVDADTVTATNCGLHAVYGIFKSMVDVDTSILSSSGSHGIFMANGSVCDASACTNTGAGGNAVYADTNSRITATGGNFSGCGAVALRAAGCSEVNGYNVDCRTPANNSAQASSCSVVRSFGTLITSGKGSASTLNVVGASGAVVWGAETVA